MSAAPLETCHDCGAAPGQLHADGCDVERCPACGLQALFCGHDATERRMPWTGEWPNTARCRELGWFARVTNGRWTPCGPGEPGAYPDLNRLYAECRWDPETQRWEVRDVGGAR